MESAGVVSGKSVLGVLRASKPSCGLRESRVVTSKVPFFGGKFGSCGGIRDLCGGLRSGFGDDGHVRYYSDGRARCVVEGGNRKKKKEEEGKVDKGKIVKKRMKLLEGLSRDLAMFIEMDFGVDDDDDVDQGKKISESAETLLKHLELLKAEEKELKRRKKEEKAEMKTVRMKDMIESEPSLSSSSSESSDNDCDEVVDMSRLKGSCTKQLQEEPQQTTTQTLVAVEASSTNFPMAEEKSTSCSSAQLLSDNIVQLAPTTTRVEVCMGNKCKKSGSMELLAEFERVVGVEGAVVGCKCLGKCRDGPNVRVLNCSDKDQAESAVLDDSVRTPTNPLCIGVGLEDVGVIVANFLVKDRGLGLNAVTA